MVVLPSNPFTMRQSIRCVSTMRATSLSKRIPTSLAKQRSFTTTKCAYEPSAAAVGGKSRLQTNRTTKSDQSIFSRSGSTSAAVAVSEDVYAPPVSYPSSFQRDLPRYKDEIPPLTQFEQPQAMCYAWVGLTGGQIFREMMRQHKVKHICKCADWND